MIVTTTTKLIETFTASLDSTKNDYSLDELKKLLSEAYKASKSGKKKGGEKKEPSKYNIFIKEEIARIREENPSVDNKLLMSLAAARWKDHKEKIATEEASDAGAVSE
jgi:hypothetical protein